MNIDFANFQQLVNLMDHADDYPTMLIGENEDENLVTTSILHDRVIVETYQSNNWIRVNTYWRDGVIEETYKR